jgi:hypothetical protein
MSLFVLLKLASVQLYVTNFLCFFFLSDVSCCCRVSQKKLISLFTHSFHGFIPMCFFMPRFPILLHTVQPNFLFCTESHSCLWQNSFFQSIVEQLGQSLMSVIMLLEHERSVPVATASILLDFLPLYSRGFSVLQVWETLSSSFFLLGGWWHRGRK